MSQTLFNHWIVSTSVSCFSRSCRIVCRVTERTSNKAMFLPSYCWLFSVAASLLLMKGLLSLGLLSPGKKKKRHTLLDWTERPQRKDHSEAMRHELLHVRVTFFLCSKKQPLKKRQAFIYQSIYCPSQERHTDRKLESEDACQERRGGSSSPQSARSQKCRETEP